VASSQLVAQNPFARPSYCGSLRDDRYVAAPTTIPAGSVVVVSGQVPGVTTPEQGAAWAREALAHGLYVVGSKRASNTAMRPWLLGTTDDARVVPFDAGFEMTEGGRFRIGWIAVYVSAPVKSSELTGLIRRMGGVANTKVLGSTSTWLSFPFVIERSADFERRLPIGSVPLVYSPGTVPPGAIPPWLPPQTVQETGVSTTVETGSRLFDPAGSTRVAMVWSPTGLLAQRPFWLLAHLQRRVRDEGWMRFDGEFADIGPDGRLYLGTIVSVAPSRLADKSRADLERRMNEFAAELNGRPANELRRLAAEGAQRVQEAYDVTVPAAEIPATARPWGMMIHSTHIPAGLSCKADALRGGSATGTAAACGVNQQWQNLQRDDAGVWRSIGWGWGAMINRQPLPSGATGTMAFGHALPYGPIDQLLTVVREMPPEMVVPARERLAHVALKAQGALADFAVVFDALVGGIATLTREARRVLGIASSAKYKLQEALQIASSAPGLRETLLSRARQYLQPDPNMDEAAQFFASAKAAVAELISKVRAALQLASTEVWAEPQAAYGMILGSLRQGVAQMERRFAIESARQRATCLYLAEAEKALGPMTVQLRTDLADLPTLSQQLATAAPNGVAVLEQLLAELADIESQVGIPWWLKRGPLRLPMYGWMAIGGAALVGAGVWAVRRKKRRAAEAK
jgi:hypothetical protein